MPGQLFKGHTYTFKKEAGELTMTDSSDHSHETITFREGVIVSGSGIITKGSSYGKGIQGYDHNSTDATFKLISNNDDGYLELFSDTKTFLRSEHDLFETRHLTHRIGNYVGTTSSPVPSGGYVNLELGRSRGDNGGCYIDLVGDTYYTDYGLRFIRKSGGQNAETDIIHRGTGQFLIKNNENANMKFQIKNAYMYWKADAASKHPFEFHNDGNNSNRYCLSLKSGTDNASGTNYLIYFRDGDGTARGSVTLSGGTVSYNPFTGCHQSYLLDDDSKTANKIETDLSDTPHYPYGSIMVSVKSEVTTLSGSTDPNLQPDHYVVTSSIHQDKRVYGVYFGSMGKNEDYLHQHQIASLGDGVVLVSNQNGNIENGDYITTASGSGGYGCKQNDDLLHNYTVAKSLEDVDWSTESESTKLIACTYHCG